MVALTGHGVAAAALPATAAESREDESTLYVDGGGICSDVRDGATEALGMPWCSIDAAVRAAPPGGTVMVRQGTYPRVALADLDPSAPITVRPYPGDRPVVGGMDLRGVSGLIVRDLTLSEGIFAARGTGLQFIGNEVALRPRGRRTSSGFIINQVRHTLIQDNHVHDGRDGVNFDDSNPPSSNVAIVGNHFEDMGNDAIHITSDQRDIVIAANLIEDCVARRDIDPAAHPDAIQALGPTRNVSILSNRVVGGRGFLFMVAPYEHDEPDRAHEGLVVANNVLTGRDFGVRLFSTRGARVVNNTVWGRQESPYSGVDLRDRHGTTNARTTGLVLANNVIRRLDVVKGVRFATRDHNLIATGPRQGPHELAGAPAFDASRLDLRLRPSSRGVDAGDASVASLVDIDGRGRRGAPDLGAYEVGGAPLLPRPQPPASGGGPLQGAWPAVPVVEAFAISTRRVWDRSVATPLIDLSPSGSSTATAPGAATLTWRTSEGALAFIRIDRRSFREELRRRACTNPRKVRLRKRRCSGPEHLAFLVRSGGEAVMRTSLTARLEGRRLPAGRYTATLVLVNRWGEASSPRSVRFRVVRP